MQWDQLCARGALAWPPNSSQTTLQGKVGCLVAVIIMTGSSFTSMPPYYSSPNIATVFSELYRTMKKLSGKADLVIYSYYVVVSG